MNFMEKGNDSDGELGPFFNTIIDKIQEVEYNEDALNEIFPSCEAS